MKIGMTELLVVFIVALFVIGPDKLPYYAKKLGEALGQFRKYSDEAARDIKESIVEPLKEAQEPLREAMEPLEELDRAVRGNVKDMKDSISDLGRPPGKRKTKPAAADGSEAESAEKSGQEAENPEKDGPEAESAEKSETEPAAADEASGLEDSRNSQTSEKAETAPELEELRRQMDELQKRMEELQGKEVSA